MSGSVADARLFDHDALTGITEYFHFDADTGGFTIQTQQDVEPLLDINRALWNESERSSRYADGMHRIASTPNVIIMELAKQGILSPSGAILDDTRYRRWLNDSSNRLFRTRTGKV